MRRATRMQRKVRKLQQTANPDVAAHLGRGQNVGRPLPSDAVDVRKSNLDPLRARKIDA